MNAPLASPPSGAGALSVVCNTKSLTVAVGRSTVRVSNDELVMVALLVKAYPQPIPRDRMMKKVFTGKRSQKDPAMCLRSLMKRVREKLKPLGVQILYTPNPIGSDQPGLYSLIRSTAVQPRGLS